MPDPPLLLSAEEKETNKEEGKRAEASGEALRRVARRKAERCRC
jgi:hypothetical protein